ncbi:SMC5-SMC6 complex localization factor protein 2-like isoform X2 [Acipenser ruthenus]|uniref:SMC5-SMC6 complex localization factor protein 2-like isoform X2 n=1 Tax=Acipenser ruthenus TaxID=7906 RepID=UPI0027425D26|nr:SMC5-SMC6 complex localization factor protein 2-like isoform X2 [Acipenser ruthenus]
MTDLSRLSSVVKDRLVLGSPKQQCSDAKRSGRSHCSSAVKPGSGVSTPPPVKHKSKPALPMQKTPDKSPVLEAIARAASWEKAGSPSRGISRSHTHIPMPSVVVKKLCPNSLSFSSFMLGSDNSTKKSVSRNSTAPRVKSSSLACDERKGSQDGDAKPHQALDFLSPDSSPSGSPPSTPRKTQSRLHSPEFQETLQNYKKQRELKRQRLEQSQHTVNKSSECQRSNPVCYKSPGSSQLCNMTTPKAVPLVNKSSSQRKVRKSLCYSPESQSRHVSPGYNSAEQSPGKRKRDLDEDDGKVKKNPFPQDPGKQATSTSKVQKESPAAVRQSPSKEGKEAAGPKAKSLPAQEKRLELQRVSSSSSSSSSSFSFDSWNSRLAECTGVKEKPNSHHSHSETVKHKAKTIDRIEFKMALLRRMTNLNNADLSPREEGPPQAEFENGGSSVSNLSVSSTERALGLTAGKNVNTTEVSHKNGTLSAVLGTPERTEGNSPTVAESGSLPSPAFREGTPGGDSCSDVRAMVPSPGSPAAASEPVVSGGGTPDRTAGYWQDSLDSDGGGAVGSLSSDSDDDDEPLLSLDEFMSRGSKSAATPEKSSYSESSTPVSSSHFTAGPSRPLSYKNSLASMLKEKEEQQRVKEIDLQFQNDIGEGKAMWKLSEELEEGSSDEEELIPEEHRDFVEKFSIISDAIPDLRPGEEIFHLSNFGKLFTEESLGLRNSRLSPESREQDALLSFYPRKQTFVCSQGFLKMAFQCAPRQPSLYKWLFQMMSVHSDFLTSTLILKGLRDLALNAAEQIVLYNNKTVRVWLPPLEDVTLVFLNMGVPFGSLFPVENLQPDFSEEDIVQSVDAVAEDAVESRECDPVCFPLQNFINVLQYLVMCTSLCPRAYSDRDKLLLLSLLCRVSLEKGLRLHPMVEIQTIIHNLLKSIRHWDTQMPLVCLTLINLAAHHHNLRWLVTLLPIYSRGRQLRRHVSLALISKLLNRSCTYTMENADLQLSELRPYLIRMKPSSLLKNIKAEKKWGNQLGEDQPSEISLDQEAYYLAHSLLALASEVVNFDSVPAGQRKHLVLLSAELEKHIKCDIRESDKLVYRSKVKDLVARIYIKWQELLQRSRPLQGKLHDYWEPSTEDASTASQVPEPEPEPESEPEPEPDREANKEPVVLTVEECEASGEEMQ